MARQPSQATIRLRKANAKQIANAKLEKSEMTSEDRAYSRILQQVQSEYQTAWNFIRPKIAEGLKRLKLYNNQLRDKDRVGDPLIYTIFQSVFSVLYNDRLNVEFNGREEGDQDQADNLNALALYDYDDMEKAEHDYDWDWDAMAFGRGLSYFNEFDYDSKTPIPQVWDPLTFIRDPDAKSVRGDRLGNGALRYGFREVWITKAEMKANEQYFNIGLLKRDSYSSAYSLVSEAEQARNTAQNRSNQASYGREADSYKILQGFTLVNGIPHLIELGNQRQLIIRLEPLLDRYNNPVKYFPLVDRSFSPIAHDWDGVSIFDILEDKQRFRAALVNIIGDAARADVYPMRLFDENKVKKSIDKSFAFNKWIPVDGVVGDAVQSLQPAGYIQKAQFILDFLDLSAQKAMATPELQQGVPTGGERTLGELQLLSSKVEGRYSLSARIFGISEKKFWRRWYEIYDRDFSGDIGKKVVRLTSAFGSKWKEVGREEIITGNILGPDIKIESKVISEATKQRNYIQLKDFFQFAFQYPNTDRLYGLRKLGRLFSPKDEVERLLPLTIDELQARMENEALNENEPVPVNFGEDHITHLREHASAKDTPAFRNHIGGHKLMLMEKRMNPEMFPMLPSDMSMPENLPSQPNNKIGTKETRTPEGAVNVQ